MRNRHANQAQQISYRANPQRSDRVYDNCPKTRGYGVG